MNHIFLALGTALSALFLIGCEADVSQTGTNNTNSNTTTPSITPQPVVTAPSTYITLEEAKEVALARANVSAEEVQFIKAEWEMDNGIPQYEIEFYVGNEEYDVEIHAVTGDILEYDREVEFGYFATEDYGTQTRLTAEEAKQIALSHSNLSDSDVTFLRVQLDYDNGIAQYEVEFYKGDTEYDYEIHAVTGDILEFDQEMESHRLNTDSNTNTDYSNVEYITEEQAKQIALEHAGYTATQVTFLKVQFDFEDGIPQYEVEFYIDNLEFDYEIHAVMGSILELDKEMETPRPSTGSNNSSSNNTGDIMTEEQAKQIALDHAGLSSSEVTFLKVKLDYDNGVPEYEVEFYKDSLEYDYEIHAISGAILEVDREMETPRPSTGSNNSSSDNTGDIMSEEEAKQVVLTHAGVSAQDVSFLKVKLDYDNGIPEYEIEFYSGNIEYDYEIHAVTGEIREFDREMESQRPNTDSNNSTNTSGTVISQAEAKAIALAHAGLSESSISKYKIELDYDDGITEYELEWEVGNTEYDYKINAYTGAILEYDIDKD